MTARLLVKDAAGVTEHPAAELSELRDRSAWLDISDPNDGELQLIADELQLHPLALEDARERHERPKIDEYEGHYFIVFYALKHPEGGELELHELSIFVMKNALVTVHNGDCTERVAVEKRWRDGRIPTLGMLLHALLDEIVDRYFPVVDSYGDRVDALETAILEDTSGRAMRSSLGDLFIVKRDLLRLRKLVSPEREVLQVLARGDLGIFPRKEAVYFQDVFDHVVRVTDEIDTFRELVSNVVDADLAAVSNRLNEVMKRLTSIATILFVMTVVTGFFGQNFTTLIPYESPVLFWSVIGGTLAFCGALALYFRRQGWL
ncbi:MAG: magnesium transporter CorA family protein [Chloroflexi bacterium]|nr:magnesium transporter CorA family protein [Chloroflexota bacterium]